MVDGGRWTERLQQLRKLYFKVAEHQMDIDPQAQHLLASPEVIEIQSDDGELRQSEMIADHLPLTWQVKCRQTTGKVPGSFIESILQWLCAAEQLETQPN